MRLGITLEHQHPSAKQMHAPFAPVEKGKWRVHLNIHHTKHLHLCVILGSEHHYSVCPLFAALLKYIWIECSFKDIHKAT